MWPRLVLVLVAQGRGSRSLGGMETTTDAARALAVEQERVGAIVSTLTEAGWRAELQPLGLERLLTMGHFPEYVAELDWTPREVVGHLRDSARIFTERIERIRAEDGPHLADFVTDEPARLEDYRSTPTDELASQLATAQARLLEAVESVGEGELARIGAHDVDGDVSLGDILAFLPAHQRDHREQLSALTAEALG